jgi:UDP-N-acetylmuramoylalanine--D-glutamate ligase
MSAPIEGRVLVLGLGRSGLAAAEVLTSAGSGRIDAVGVVDEGHGEALEYEADRLRDRGVDVRLGTSAVDGSWDLVVASPGIPPRSELMGAARGLGAPIISEIELAYRLTSSPFVAVTGTNGKTTVTSLVAHLLGASGVPAEAVGNIGRPATRAAVDAGPATVLVTEVSSFQLALTSSFRPRVAMLLNITPDHLDWHGGFEAYERDKAKVFANLAGRDLAVVNVDDAGSAPYAERLEDSGARVMRVGLEGPKTAGAWLQDGTLVVGGDRGTVGLVGVDELKILGAHNVSNALAGSVAALEMGAQPDGVREGLRTFAPIEHRLEPVDWVEGVEYFNDSKATNPDATMKALTAFAGRPLVLLLGGRNKGNDFVELARRAAETCRAVVVFGEAAPTIEDDFGTVDLRVIRADGMRGAVREARAVAEEGDAVLLSPACASFDEFSGGYEERGRAYKEEVAALAVGGGVA